ncbi:hypothetical protein GW17_00060446 [Ensete ventricosum]|nr:hypothetical protein GW17_00060446 [Ensete ventricosum]
MANQPKHACDGRLRKESSRAKVAKEFLVRLAVTTAARLPALRQPTASAASARRSVVCQRRWPPRWQAGRTRRCRLHTAAKRCHVAGHAASTRVTASAGDAKERILDKKTILLLRI